MVDAVEHFSKFLQNKGVRQSRRRNQVLEVLVACESHVTVNELIVLVHKTNPKIGIATVYRTLKLIVESGIARTTEFGDGVLRYEHDYGHAHHDHLVCFHCGDFREISNEKIEKEQEKVAAEYGFRLIKHKMVLYGICPKCMKSVN